MKAPGSKSSSKNNSKEEQQAEVPSAVNTSKKADPVKKLQVDADIWCHTGHLFATFYCVKHNLCYASCIVHLHPYATPQHSLFSLPSE